MIDASTLAELWSSHADRLHLVARALGGSAEDVVQQAFVRLALENQLPENTFAWLVTVVRNEVYQENRKRSRRRRHEQAASERWLMRQGESSTDEIDAGEVTEELKRISSQQREIIVLHLWGGMTFEEIAQQLGLSRATAHRIYQRGIRELKHKLNPADSNSEVAET